MQSWERKKLVKLGKKNVITKDKMSQAQLNFSP